MIRILKLINYRCFEKSEIQFKKTTIIVGSNNAGKSTLTEAIRIVGLAARKLHHTTYVQAPRELNLPAITKGFYLHVEELDVDLRTIVYQYKEDTFAEVIAIFDNGVNIHIYLSQELVFACVKQGNKIITKKSEAMKICDLNLHIMPQLRIIQDDEKRLASETVMKSIETRLSSRHFRNEVYQYKNEYFDAFREMAQTTWPGLKIQDIIYDMEDQCVKIIVYDAGYSSEIGLMGSGLQMWLQIIWFISRNNSDATIVLDEPDVYMHPDLQRRLLQMVLKKFKQIIIATHSVEIMSGVDADQIITVDKSTKKMVYADNFSAVQDIICNLGSTHNLSLSKIGTARKCVFVEGKDIKTLAKLQSRYEAEYRLSVDQLPTVELGGWNRYNEALGASRLFYEETKGEIKTYCILDRDFHTESEIEEIRRKAYENHLILHVWEKKEIENYLLTPNSIFRASELPMEEKESFLESLEIELNTLKDSTRDSIMDYLNYIDKSGKGPSYWLKEANKILEKSWISLEGILATANGKNLISKINTFIKEKYGISCSRTKLILALQPEDISQEVKETISKLLE